MYGLMKKMANGTTLKNCNGDSTSFSRKLQVIGTAMFITYTITERKFSIPAVFYKHLEKFSGSTHKAGCMVHQDNSSTNNTYRSEDANSSTNESQEKHTHSQPPDVELKIILLGATGSGKSTAGNVLLQEHGNDKGFKTSCFAESETKSSILQSVNRPIETNEVSKIYKIDIIDTPAKRDTGLSDSKFKNEMGEAKRLSSPGPHAFLLCIPANGVLEYFTEDVDYYNKYFDGALYDSTVVVFTRCDQYKCENNREFDSNRAMEQHHVLKKMKKHITLSHTLSEEEKIHKLEEVIGHIIDRKTSPTCASVPFCICCAILAGSGLFTKK